MIVAQVSQASPSRAPQFRLHFPTREIRTHQEWVTTRAAACLRCCTFSFVLDIDKRHRIPTGWSFKTSFRVKEAVYSQTSLTILEPVKLEDLNKPVEQASSFLQCLGNHGSQRHARRHRPALQRAAHFNSGHPWVAFGDKRFR